MKNGRGARRRLSWSVKGLWLYLALITLSQDCNPGTEFVFQSSLVIGLAWTVLCPLFLAFITVLSGKQD